MGIGLRGFRMLPPAGLHIDTVAPHACRFICQ